MFPRIFYIEVPSDTGHSDTGFS